MDPDYGKTTELRDKTADRSPDDSRSEETGEFYPQVHDVRNLLINSLSGYFEANLSKNMIIGDIIDIADNCKKSKTDPIGSDGKRLGYDEYEKWWADHMLISSPSDFLEMSNCRYLISRCRDGQKVVDVICTCKNSLGAPKELRQTYYLSESPSGDVYAICAVSNITNSLESVKYSRQYAEIAAALTDSFEGVFYVDIRDDSYVSLKAKGVFYHVSRKFSGQNFFEGTVRNLKGAVNEEDYLIAAEFINKEYLLKRLEQGQVTSMVYRLMADGKEIFYRTRVSNAGCDAYHIVFAVENVNESVINERYQNEKLMRDRDIIGVLSSEYSSIYYVDLVTDSYEIYKLDNEYYPISVKNDGGKNTFTEAYNLCVDEMVYEPDQKEMRLAGSIYNILTVLRGRDSFTTTYRSRRSNGTQYCEMKIVRIENEEFARSVVIGFADNNIEKTKEIEKAQNISIVLQLTNNFEAVYDIDIRTGRCRCYSESDLFTGDKFFGRLMNGDFFKNMKEASEWIVFDDDRPLVSTFLTREYLKKELVDNHDFQMDFRVLLNGTPIWYHLKAVMNEDSVGQRLIIGLFNIEEQREKDFSHIIEVKKLTKEAHYDMLTGIRNRNAYIFFEYEMDKSMKESDDPFSVVVFDINDLKKTNDTLGHEYGDQLIRSVSQMLCSTFCHSPVFRIGGDEFVAILKGTDYDNRKELISEVREISRNNRGANVPVTACGISDRNENDRCLADVFKRADREMYKDKKQLKKPCKKL